MLAWNAGRLADWRECVDEIPDGDFELFFELWQRGYFDERRDDLRMRQVVKCLYAIKAQEFPDSGFDYLGDVAEESEVLSGGPSIEASRENVRGMLHRAAGG